MSAEHVYHWTNWDLQLGLKSETNDTQSDKSTTVFMQSIYLIISFIWVMFSAFCNTYSSVNFHPSDISCHGSCSRSNKGYLTAVSYNLGETNINTIENKKDKNWFTYKYQEYPYELYFVDLNMHVNKNFQVTNSRINRQCSFIVDLFV